MDGKKQSLRRAVRLSSVAVGIYLANYLFRNLLSVAAPLMFPEGFTGDGVALLSSVYMLSYALGQLVNGPLGDYVKPRLMVSGGLLLAGAGMLLFPSVSRDIGQAVCFALLGFGLSALRGPLIKTVSENTEHDYASFCCVLISVTTFAGPLLAGIMIAKTGWSGAFRVSGVLALALAAAAYLILLRFEKTGLIAPAAPEAKGEKSSVLDLFKVDRFVLFLFLAMLTEIVISSVGFWIPTLLTERFGCTAEAAGEIYSVMSLVQSLGAFAVIWTVKLFKGDCVKTIGVMFAFAALFFGLTAAVPCFGAGVAMLGAARLASGMASSALWAVYIPSLADTGKVSGANGILDFAGYLGASGANLVLSALIEPLGWARMPLSFAAFSLLGALICLTGIVLNKSQPCGGRQP